MVEIERAAKSKALLLAAKNGSWSVAEALVAELGASSWRRKNLMGESPEAAGFEHGLETSSMPSARWLASMPEDQRSFNGLEAMAVARIKSGQAKDLGAAGLRWLALAAPRAPWAGVFSDAGSALEDVADVSGWAQETGKRARAGELSREWVKAPGFWALAGRAKGQEGESLFEALGAGGLRAPLLAAMHGADDFARRWIEALSPRQALALMAAGSCASIEQWEEFEQGMEEDGVLEARRLGIQGQDGQSGWRALACSAAGFERPWSGMDAGFVSRGVQWSAPQFGEGKAAGWERAMEQCAKKASLALAAPSLEHGREWIARRVAPKIGAKALPLAGALVDFSGMDESAVVDALGKLALAELGVTERAGRAAAARLWEEKIKRDALWGGAARARVKIDEAAMALWRAADARGFDAFVGEIVKRAGSAGEAAELCGFPSPALLYGREEPGCPGQIIALLRQIPSGASYGSGESVWASEGREMALRGLREKASEGALGGLIDGSAMDSWKIAAPQLLPDSGQWGGLDLGEAKWRAGQGATDAVEGWEGAFEAIEVFAHSVGGIEKEGLPPRPKKDGISAPSRNAWRRLASLDPGRAAKWLCEQWIMGAEGASDATELSKVFSASEKWALAKAAPKAFEEIGSSGVHAKAARGSSVGKACRLAARALAEDDGAGLSARDALCAAAMSAISFGMVESMGNKALRNACVMGSVQKWKESVAHSARELGEFLAQAASAVSIVGFDGGPGFSGADLAGKALWGAIGFKALGLGEGAPGMAAWSQAGLDASNPWVKSSLCALFTPEALEAGHEDIHMRVLEEASGMLRACGSTGWERLPTGRSALELAVDCRAERLGARRRETWGNFGEAAVKKLVELGASPSDAEAPGGLDALALCCELERKASPSSVMKALLRSKQARPGSGALWSRLAHGKSTLSDKLVDDLRAKAQEEPSLEALAQLASLCPEIRPKQWLGAALEPGSGAAVSGPDLLWAMVALGAPCAACASASSILAAAGIKTSDRSKKALFDGALRELNGFDMWGFGKNFGLWIGAGAEPRNFKPSELGASWSKACLDFGLQESVGIGEAMMAKTWSCLNQSKPVISQAARLAKAALDCSPEWFGSGGPSSAGRLLEWAEASGTTEAFAKEMGPESFAKLEAAALVDIKAKASTGPSKRL